MDLHVIWRGVVVRWVRILHEHIYLFIFFLFFYFFPFFSYLFFNCRYRYGSAKLNLI